jgi:23S rRNA pseudouridine1911/1915/1917 synthase
MRQETGIVHLKISASIAVRSFIQAQGYSQEQADHFLFRGCVYVDGVRIRKNVDLKPDQILRLHTKPKSYSWEPGPLKERIVFDDPEFLVLDKPAGLPVHATLDNYVDNAKYQLERELRIPLFSTHRLDIPTQGLLILAKTPDAQRVINKTFAKGRVEKIYHAIAENPVALGEHTLYINPESRVPREHSFEPREGWWECRLEVLESGSVTQHIYRKEPGTFLRIRLITGKTHQIRAQLAALGTPIDGDVLYGSQRNYVPERLALECYSLSFTFRSRTLALTRPNSIVLAPPPRLKDFEFHSKI